MMRKYGVSFLLLVGLSAFFGCDKNDNPIGVYSDVNQQYKIPGVE